MTTHILVADDDRAIRESLQRALELDGYRVSLAADGVEAAVAARAPDVDAVILDVGMPGIDGIGVVQLLRAEGVDTPVLMLTARVSVDARVTGLDAGADDYLPKPFDLDELAARLRALVRRSRSATVAGETPHETIVAGPVRIDASARRVWCRDLEVTLSKTEFELLELLARHRGQVLTHAVIYDRIWQYDFGPDSNNLAVYISYLRRKLDDVGCPDMISTVRGVGYRFDAP